MRFKDIEVGKKYIQVSRVNTIKRGGCQNYSRVNNIYVLKKDEDKRMVLASINGLPASWMNHRKTAKWEQNTDDAKGEKN